MLAVTLALFTVTKLAVERVERTHYQQRADLYRYSKINKGDIVFVGDSITDGGCWDELFPGLNIKNRGINADDTVGVLARLGDILCCEPSALFILIGTNDLNWWNYRHYNEILENYLEILKSCKERSPGTQVFIQSILPRARRFAKIILTLNAELEKMARDFGYTFIDLFPAFADKNNALKAEFTNDHLHLMSSGYIQWVKLLTPHLEKLTKK
jgi:lysophospholipase L1-like esterase